MSTRQQRKKVVALPSRFVPQFWENEDRRCSVVKEIRRRYEELKAHAGVESYQKDVLCQRAVFIGVQLETMECVATDSGKFDAGVYTQMTNTLLGLLKALGLERNLKQVVDLKTYMKGRNK
jgi:hypothetical protein